MLSFPLTSVREVITRGRADAGSPWRLSQPLLRLRPGKDEKPGLWLIGDQGVSMRNSSKP